jgi:hypothetical protein
VNRNIDARRGCPQPEDRAVQRGLRPALLVAAALVAPPAVAGSTVAMDARPAVLPTILAPEPGPTGAVAPIPDPLARPAKMRLATTARVAGPTSALPAEAAPAAAWRAERPCVPADAGSPARPGHSASVPVRGPPLVTG